MHRLEEAREDYRGIAVLEASGGGFKHFSPSSDPVAVMDAEDRNPDSVIYGTSLDDILYKLEEMYPNDSDIPELSSRVNVNYYSEIDISISDKPQVSDSNITDERILDIAREIGKIETNFPLPIRFGVRPSDQGISVVGGEFIIDGQYIMSFDPKRARRLRGSRAAGMRKRIKNGSIKVGTVSSFALEIFDLMKSDYTFFHVVNFWNLRPSYTSWEHISLALIEIFIGVKSEKELAKYPFVKSFVLDHLEYVKPMMKSAKYKRPELAKWMRKMKRKYYPDRLLKKTKKKK